MSVTSESNFESVMEAVLELDVGDQWKVVETLLKSLKKSAKPTKRVKKEKDPDAPKKPLTPWVQHTMLVGSVLKPLILELNKERTEETKVKTQTCVFQVAGTLKEKGLVGSSTEEQIREAFEEWLAAPPTVSKAQERKAKKAESVGDSDEEKEAKKAAKAAEKEAKKAAKESAKQTKEAKKAEKKDSKKDSKKPAKKPEPEAEESDAESEAEEEAAEAAAEDDAVEGVLKTYKINGKEGKYSCYANEDEANTEYLCDAVTGAFVGLYNTKTKVLKTDVEDPFA